MLSFFYKKNIFENAYIRKPAEQMLGGLSSFHTDYIIKSVILFFMIQYTVQDP